ncbi:MAG: helix-turn-helix transcriptional regulator [Clostridia bacterium]|nr:helix-turn-helix transcriptional regulator [Clostridia bacterium]
MSMFAQRLKELRLENELSQNQLSKQLGVSQAAINKWEKGIIIPTLDSAVIVAKFFGVSIDYLAGLED